MLAVGSCAQKECVPGSMQARNDCLAADSTRTEGICCSPGLKNSS